MVVVGGELAGSWRGRLSVVLNGTDDEREWENLVVRQKPRFSPIGLDYSRIFGFQLHPTFSAPISYSTTTMAADKARFYLEQSLPELREYEKKKVFTTVSSDYRPLQRISTNLMRRKRYNP
jgi:hypothetical protein